MRTDNELKRELVHVMFRLKNMGMQLPNKYIASKNIDLNLTEITFLMHLAKPEDFPSSHHHHPHPHHHHPHKPSDIKDFMCVSKGAISQTISSLEKKGYVTREINPENRRKLNVTLTEKGIAILKDSQDDMDDMMLTLLNKFGEDNTKNLVALLNKFADVMKEVESE